MADFENLELVRAIAFDGGVRGGLQAHPGGEHLVYPAGSTLVVERISGTRQQRFLQGTSANVLCDCMCVCVCVCLVVPLSLSECMCVCACV